ncbi:MAG TPA: hypothetical protein PLF42_02360 [Anaerolineales bacterium]|nr:hypothetical protein [Anaerolineales bacterium]
MADRKKSKKQGKPAENTPPQSNRAAQFLFIIFAVLIIISMVLSAAVTY